MNLLEAPFGVKLKIAALLHSSEDTRLILQQLGLFVDELVEKLHAAPLGDPITLRVGAHRFSLRKEICSQIQVEGVA